MGDNHQRNDNFIVDSAIERAARLSAEERYQSLFRRIPAIVHSLDDRGVIIEVSDYWLHVMGYRRADVVGHRSTEFLTEECRLEVQTTSLPAFMATGRIEGVVYQMVSASGAIIDGRLSAVAEYNAEGRIIHTLAIVADVTALTQQAAALRASEVERQLLQEQLIEAQAQAIRELSTPLLQIGEGILVMPLVGAIDSVRITLITETLLLGVQRQRANVIILDITGVQMLDTLVADTLVRAARATQLLGAAIFLTGINAEAAQTLVSLGITLDGIQTFGSLQTGVAAALRRRDNL